MITYHSCTTDDELRQILKLQHQNLPASVSKDQKKTDGFVTVHHTFELLKEMNKTCPHMLAKDGNQVVGYALCMHPKFGDEIDILKPMFAEIYKHFSNQNEMLKQACLPRHDRQVQHDIKNYLVMGQVCIAKAYRGQGIFRKLYEKMKAEVIPPFSCIITEVDTKNKRSLQAHFGIGFQKMRSYQSGGQDWEIIYLT
ncbi:GNAT family N-acetyltransferase [Jejudonia soesokkakensis]|uniref:GNAT family N-acetyltransferase n=1 Tax=Jejudonia soesokkakensis TaxID=1323432 RepID=A0ABW2MNB3_9FLAO